MTPDRRYAFYAARLSPLVMLAAIGWGGWMVYAAWSLPTPAVASVVVAKGPRLTSSTAVLPADLDWGVFQNEEAAVPTSRGALSRRFRLAGTFFAYGSESGDTRKAVLHDLGDGVQHIVGEQAKIGDVEVVRIMSDRVILRRGAEEAELWLGFSRADESVPSGEEVETAKAENGEDLFGGRKTGENDWVFRRDALQDYYEAVLDDPERLVRIFDSMKAVRGADNKIEGYRLDILGEGEFYHAVGMRQGDIVHKVNGMSMTSRRRAEFFIGEFARNRANAFVIEIERDGAPEKLTYQVR